MCCAQTIQTNENKLPGMKPTMHFSTNLSARRFVGETAPRPFARPKTDYHFLGPIAPRRPSGPPEKKETGSSPAFREISRQYSRAESHATFAAEATLFAIVTVIVAVPIARMLLDVARLMGFMT